MRLTLLLLFCALGAGCGGPESGPEEQLRAWVDAMEVAAEEKDRRAMLDRIADSYADARGNTRKDIGDRLLLQFMRTESIAMVSTIDRIDVSGDSAANLAVTVAMGGKDTGRFALSADAYRFELELQKPQDEWLLIGARWAELGKDVR